MKSPELLHWESQGFFVAFFTGEGEEGYVNPIS
jgi:hypothetical protein